MKNKAWILCFLFIIPISASADNLAGNTLQKIISGQSCDEILNFQYGFDKQDMNIMLLEQLVSCTEEKESLKYESLSIDELNLLDGLNIYLQKIYSQDTESFQKIKEILTHDFVNSTKKENLKRFLLLSKLQEIIYQIEGQAYEKPVTNIVYNNSYSKDINHHQGVAIGKDFNILFGTHKITKTDQYYEPIQILNEINTKLNIGTNHIGDGAIDEQNNIYLSIEMYTPGESSNQYILILNEKLEIENSKVINISQYVNEISSIATDNNFLYISDYEYGNKVYKFDMYGKYKDTIVLDGGFSGIQGIEIIHNEIYVSKTGYLFRYNMNGDIISYYKLPYSNEGISSFDNQVLHVLQDSGELEEIFTYTINY